MLQRFGYKNCIESEEIPISTHLWGHFSFWANSMASNFILFFSYELSKWPHYFPAYFVQLVDSGQDSPPFLAPWDGKLPYRFFI